MPDSSTKKEETIVDAKCVLSGPNYSNRNLTYLVHTPSTNTYRWKYRYQIPDSVYQTLSEMKAKKIEKVKSEEWQLLKNKYLDLKGNFNYQEYLQDCKKDNVAKRRSVSKSDGAKDGRSNQEVKNTNKSNRFGSNNWKLVNVFYYRFYDQTYYHIQMDTRLLLIDAGQLKRHGLSREEVESAAKGMPPQEINYTQYIRLTQQREDRKDTDSVSQQPSTVTILKWIYLTDIASDRLLLGVEQEEIWVSRERVDASEREWKHLLRMARRKLGSPQRITSTEFYFSICGLNITTRL